MSLKSVRTRHNSVLAAGRALLGDALCRLCAGVAKQAVDWTKAARLLREAEVKMVPLTSGMVSDCIYTIAYGAAASSVLTGASDAQNKHTCDFPLRPRASPQIQPTRVPLHLSPVSPRLRPASALDRGARNG